MNALPLAWPALPVMPVQIARMRNSLAFASIRQATPVLDGVPYAISATVPLTSYPLTLFIDTAAGPCLIALDVGMLAPELSAQVLRAIAVKDGGDIDGIADWLFAPWLDALEAALGVSMHINQVLFDAPAPLHSVAIQLRDPAGRRGTVAFSGAPFAALAHHESANRRQIMTILGTLPLSATWKIGATGLRLADLAALQPHAVLFPDSRKLLCSFTTLTGMLHLLGHLQGQLFTVHTTEIIDMQSYQESDTEGLVTLENLSAEIDIVLERVVMPLSQVATLASGSVLPLTQLSTGRNVTLYCRNLPFARGEIVVVGQRLGILLLEKVNLGLTSEAPGVAAEAVPRRRHDD